MKNDANESNDIEDDAVNGNIKRNVNEDENGNTNGRYAKKATGSKSKLRKFRFG